MPSASLRFPDGFVWGVATASAQIEGAASVDGKGESIWDRFAATPGKVKGGDTPAVACDHYHRYEADADLLQQFGVSRYRLSVAWPRVVPDGSGPVNPRGLDFYDRLIDALLARHVTPWVTLFHWDLPQPLEDRGGWLDRRTVDAFRAYAEAVVGRLGDRIKHWFTLNEIPCFIGHGYGTGIFAPGLQVEPKRLNQGYHHALLAHGHAVEAIRAGCGPEASRWPGPQPPSRAADPGGRVRGRHRRLPGLLRADQPPTDGSALSRLTMTRLSSATPDPTPPTSPPATSTSSLARSTSSA